MSVLPTNDPDFLAEQTEYKEQVCCTCGKKKSENRGSDVCNNCKDDQWMGAII
jgi:hypothetical protein